MKNKSKIKRIILISILLTISIVISILESFISFTIPGIKLGLANIVILLCLYNFNLKITAIVLLIRIFLVSILLGTFLSVPFYISLTGGIFALTSMILFKKINKFSIIGVSMMGAIFHSIGQISATFIILESFISIYYLPIIMICSLFSGLFTGIVADKINKIYLSKFLNL